MRTFTRLLRLDLTLQARSFLYPATVVSTAMICGFILLIPTRPLPPQLTALFVFMDPAIIGLSFVGAMVLMEKAQGTLFALGVTPVESGAYVAAKTVSLTTLTFASSFVVVLVATRGAFDPLRGIIAVALSSTVVVLIGLICVARAASMNHLLATLLWVTTLLYLPLLDRFDILPGFLTPLVALIPSYAMLLLLEASADAGSVALMAQAGSALFLAAWVWVGWRRTVREFVDMLVTEGR
jgi:ABC-type Na+ efflux pump permease subunit